MPALKRERWERFARLLASPDNSTLTDSYAAAGYRPDRAHAARLANHPAVAGRVNEILAATGRVLAARMAREEQRAVSKNVVSREGLIEEAQHALRVAEDAQNAAAMVSCIRLLAELSLLPMKPPEDRPPQQHLHVHGFVDRPPPETLEQWIARKERELGERSAHGRLKLVDKDK
jgi:hypothetical protein